MSEKSTYEELEKRIQELEQAEFERQKAEKSSHERNEWFALDKSEVLHLEPLHRKMTEKQTVHNG